MEQWLCVEQTELYPAMKKVFAQCAARMWGQKDPGEAVGEEGKMEVSCILDVLNRALAVSDYLAAPRLSLADLCWLPDLSMLFDASLGELIIERPSLAAWWRRVSARPSWRNVLARLSAQQHA